MKYLVTDMQVAPGPKGRVVVKIQGHTGFLVVPFTGPITSTERLDALVADAFALHANNTPTVTFLAGLVEKGRREIADEFTGECLAQMQNIEYKLDTLVAETVAVYANDTPTVTEEA